MQFNAPFTLDQQIVLNLTQSQANGNLGNLAAQGVGSGGQVNALNQTQPFVINLPPNSIMTGITCSNTGNIGVLDKLVPINFKNSTFPISDVQPTDSNIDFIPAGIPIAGIYNNGLLGVGATLTTVLATITAAGGQVAADGQTWMLNDQVDPKQNGIYDISGTGVAIVFTRTATFDVPSGIQTGQLFLTDDGSWYGCDTTFTLPTEFGNVPINYTFLDLPDYNGGLFGTAHSAFYFYPFGTFPYEGHDFVGTNYYSQTDSIPIAFVPCNMNVTQFPIFNGATVSASLIYLKMEG